MISWYIQLDNNNFKRISSDNAKLYKDKIIADNNSEQIVLSSVENTEKYLYGDILFMLQEGNVLRPLPLPLDVDINLLEHPQVQEFIINSRNKLKLQIKKYEEILESLKQVEYEEENFEKQFFSEFNNLRSNMLKDTSEFLQEKMNLTKKKIKKIINETKDEKSDINKDLVAFTQGELIKSKKMKKQKRIVNPKLKELFKQ